MFSPSQFCVVNKERILLWILWSIFLEKNLKKRPNLNLRRYQLKKKSSEYLKLLI